MNTSRQIAVRTAIATSFIALSGAMPASAAPAQDITFVDTQGATIGGKLYKPSGHGRFPAVVMLPDCANASADRAADVWFYRNWGERLASAGYVALLVEGGDAKGPGQCSLEQAEGAYDFLARGGMVDAGRIGLMGWAQGGSAALAAIDISRLQGGKRQFKAAVSFSPDCTLDNAYGGTAHSTWLPYAPLKVVHVMEDKLYKDGKCLSRITRAQQLGADTVSLVASGGGGKDSARRLPGRFGEAVALNHLNQVLMN